MKTLARVAFSATTTLLFVLLCSMTQHVYAQGLANAPLVISQVYGGAGCGTAGCSTYQNDFIEIYNRSNFAISLNGKSVQYAAATGTTWQVTPLTNVTLQPGQYYLVAESFGANGVSPLPTPDTTGTIAMSATAAKIALVNGTTALSGSACPLSAPGVPIIDFVGYGTTASCSEGAANAPAPSTTTADIRKVGGTQDTNNNLNDFDALAPTPRNTASTFGTTVIGAAALIISEFRQRGPAGAADEFIEIYNNSNATLSVLAPDGSAGFALATSDSTVRSTIANGTTIPPRGHYLIANTITSPGYSLNSYAAPDGGIITTDIPDNLGIALFNTATVANFTTANRLDAIGLTGETNTTYREGTGLAAINTAPGVNDQFSFVRKLTSGLPQDTNDNATDFVLVSTSGQVGTASATLAVLGAPGPENMTSPFQRNAEIKASLIDPNAGTGSPNRLRDTTPYLDALTPSSPTGVTTGVPNSTYSGGTLSIQRRFTNNTGQTIPRLRFRVVDVTTLNSPGYTVGGAQADVRFLTSNGTLRAPVGVTLLGVTINQPPTQQFGAALNSSGAVTLPGGSLAQGASVDVQFLLGVVQGGSFRYLVNVEASPAPPGFAAPQPTNTKGAHITKQ